MEVIGYIGHYDQARALAGLRERVESTGLWLTQVSPSWYFPAPSGEIVNQAATVDDSDTVLAALRAAGVRIVPAIANTRGGSWDAAAVTGMLGSPAAQAKAVNNIVNLARSRGFHGIDLDFENGVPGDREPYVRFVKRLAKAMHQYGKTVSVAVHPKLGEPGTWPGSQAQNYAALGAAADELRVMLYSYHGPHTGPGPVTPTAWARDVAAWAVSQVPPSKVILGLAAYGYDWTLGTPGAQSLMRDDAVDLAAAKNATIEHDLDLGGAHFGYEDHEVWFEDAESLAPKVELARTMAVRGVHVWRLGGDDPAIWQLGR